MSGSKERTESVWQATKTFFPLFVAQLEAGARSNVCVVGASDGKFVLPLARRGLRVTAIERDPVSVHGGPVTLPGPRAGSMSGLHARLSAENLAELVTVVEADLFDVAGHVEPADAVWTSCSWHYSVNRGRQLSDFLLALETLVRPGAALFGAEYMMPIEPAHFSSEHYPDEGALRRHFADWDILWEASTPAFVEDAHVGRLEPHIHRMGLLIASGRAGRIER